MKNRQIIIKALGGGCPVFINQVHGKKLLVLKKNKKDIKKCKQGISDSFDSSVISSSPAFSDHPCVDSVGSLLPCADGMVTDIPGLLLFIQVADCQSVMLYDPAKKAVANIHSGWKGSIKNIIGAGIDTMKQEFGSDPCDILAGIGPSLGPCCSEFVNYKSEIPEEFLIYKRGKNHFDFWQMSIDQLTGKGLKPENIELSRICTKCFHDSFFSYRYAKITGRFAAVIGLL